MRVVPTYRNSTDSQQRITLFISMIAIVTALLTISSCGTNGGQSSTEITPSKQQPIHTIAGALADLHMINTMDGWSQSMHFPTGDTSIYFTILHTTDGGVNWKTVLKCSPYQGSGGKGSGFATCPSDFRSATIATVLETEQSQLNIYHTSDGGQSWQRSTIQAGYLETPPVFVDAMHGWVLATDNYPGNDPGSAYIGKEIALFRTVNGGQTWQRILSTKATSQLPNTSDDAYGTAPLTASARMQFATSSTGWMAGTSYRMDSSSFSWLYVTHDGGLTWQQVSIPFPAQSMIAWPPTFFSSQDGLLPVLTSGPAPQYTPGTMLFATHDSGQTWTGTPIAFDATNAAYMDMSHAWVQTSNSNKHTFYTTSDGGSHWTTGQMHSAFKNIRNVSFVSPLVGWALADNRTMFFPEPGGGLRTGDVIALLKTVDGGHTWQEIARSVV